jgi:hypothetical protein
MNSAPVMFSMGFKGFVKGLATSPNIKLDIGATARCDFSGTGKMVYDAATSGARLSIPVSGTTTLNLQSGLTSPLGETITGALDFALVYAVWIYHDPDSLATAGITAFGGGSNDFQGPFAAGNKPTLLPGQGVGIMTTASKTGWTVDGTHKNIAIVNLDATALHVATVWAFIMGTV